jgi:hypothetical protein
LANAIQESSLTTYCDIEAVGTAMIGAGRKKLFDRREDAEPVVVRLRKFCPSNAESINVEMRSADGTKF